MLQYVDLYHRWIPTNRYRHDISWKSWRHPLIPQWQSTQAEKQTKGTSYRSSVPPCRPQQKCRNNGQLLCPTLLVKTGETFEDAEILCSTRNLATRVVKQCTKGFEEDKLWIPWVHVLDFELSLPMEWRRLTSTLLIRKFLHVLIALLPAWIL